jgi:hypothetical protein
MSELVYCTTEELINGIYAKKITGLKFKLANSADNTILYLQGYDFDSNIEG